MPILKNTYGFNVGVFAGNLSTTTPAYCPAKKSILCPGGLPKDPEPDVYREIIGLINDGKVKGDPGEPGKDGQDGKDGKDGVDGESGVYIGSEEPTGDVNVWIDPNGEASDLEGEYELIETFTLDEDAVIDRRNEPNGNPYKFKAIMIYLAVESPTESANLYFYSGGKAIGLSYIGKRTETTKAYACYSCEPKYSHWLSGWKNNWSSTESGAGIDRLNYHRMRDNKVSDYPHITRIITTANPLPAGTTIEIWGVRA